MSCKCIRCGCKVTNSVLSAKASEEIEKEVEEELEVPDPSPEEAMASINECKEG
jgi:hypothetical protein